MNIKYEYGSYYGKFFIKGNIIPFNAEDVYESFLKSKNENYVYEKLWGKEISVYRGLFEVKEDEIKKSRIYKIYELSDTIFEDQEYINTVYDEYLNYQEHNDKLFDLLWKRPYEYALNDIRFKEYLINKNKGKENKINLNELSKEEIRLQNDDKIITNLLQYTPIDIHYIYKEKDGYIKTSNFNIPFTYNDIYNFYKTKKEEIKDINHGLFNTYAVYNKKKKRMYDLSYMMDSRSEYERYIDEYNSLQEYIKNFDNKNKDKNKEFDSFFKEPYNYMNNNKKEFLTYIINQEKEKVINIIRNQVGEYTE